MRYFIIPQDDSQPIKEKTFSGELDDFPRLRQQLAGDIGANYLESVRPRLIQDLVRGGKVDKIWDFPIMLLVDDIGSYQSGVNRRASTFYTTETRGAYLYGDVAMVSYAFNPMEGDELQTLPDTITVAQLEYLFDQRLPTLPL